MFKWNDFSSSLLVTNRALNIVLREFPKHLLFIGLLWLRDITPVKCFLVKVIWVFSFKKTKKSYFSLSDFSEFCPTCYSKEKYLFILYFLTQTHKPIDLFLFFTGLPSLFVCLSYWKEIDLKTECFHVVILSLQDDLHPYRTVQDLFNQI